MYDVADEKQLEEVARNVSRQQGSVQYIGTILLVNRDASVVKDQYRVVGMCDVRLENMRGLDEKMRERQKEYGMESTAGSRHFYNHGPPPYKEMCLVRNFVSHVSIGRELDREGVGLN
ncbi:hypothetical protein BGZ54_003119 [Gamsiella multidivaricata]|nr:hypothetical protein BGZ54_003119 [Gamsiella multidivaricata]